MQRGLGRRRAGIRSPGWYEICPNRGCFRGRGKSAALNHRLDLLRDSRPHHTQHTHNRPISPIVGVSCFFGMYWADAYRPQCQHLCRHLPSWCRVNHRHIVRYNVVVMSTDPTTQDTTAVHLGTMLRIGSAVAALGARALSSSTTAASGRVCAHAFLSSLTRPSSRVVLSVALYPPGNLTAPCFDVGSDVRVKQTTRCCLETRVSSGWSILWPRSGS